VHLLLLLLLLPVWEALKVVPDHFGVQQRWQPAAAL
jgi:hypothetical protein